MVEIGRVVTLAVAVENVEWTSRCPNSCVATFCIASVTKGTLRAAEVEIDAPLYGILSFLRKT